MGELLRRAERRGRPRVAVLAPHWGGTGERAWALRQVAGALALSADVHVLTPQGRSRRGHLDGVLTVHELASRQSWATGMRRDLVLTLLRGRDGLASDERRQLVSVLDEGQDDWDALGDLLEDVHPDLVVLADHREVGAARLAERRCPDVPVVGVPLAARLTTPADPYFEPWFARVGATLVFTDAEAALVGADASSPPVHNVGLPLAANPSVQREPHTFVGDREYALVLTGVPWAAPQWPTTLAALLQVGLPAHAVAVAATDRLSLFHRGEERQTAGVTRGTDLLRLMAWAVTSVDLRPGSLFARRSVESLLYGSPIVVPAKSRAHEHAATGRGGLWFEGAGDLLWCVESLFDADTHGALARQGRAYATARYSGTDAFVDRISRAVLPVIAAVGAAP